MDARPYVGRGTGRRRLVLGLSAADAIRAALPLIAAPGIPEIRLHIATPSSRVRHLVETYGGDTPYWAYPWAGGLALARHILEHPEAVAGKRVLDLGSGSGLVAIAATLSGAASVTAAEIDPLACIAIRLNAGANGVELDIVQFDLLDGEVPAVDLIVGGDVFYSDDVARRVGIYLARCVAAGVHVLVGDPERRDLQLDRLAKVAEYEVSDFGSDALGKSCVYEFVLPKAC